MTSERDGTLTRLDPDSGEPVGEPLQLGAGDLRGRGRRPARSGSTDPRARRAAADRPRRAAGVLQRIDGRRPPRRRSPSAAAASGSPTRRAAAITAVNAEGGRVFRRGLAPHAAPLRLAVGAGGLWVSSASTGNRAPHRPRHACAPARRSRSAAARPASPSPTASSGSPTAAPTPSPGSTPRSTPCSATRSRSAAAPAASTPAPAPSGSPAPPRTRSPGSTSRAASAIGAPIEVGPEPGAVAVGGDAVWVADNGDGTVTRIEP